MAPLGAQAPRLLADGLRDCENRSLTRYRCPGAERDLRRSKLLGPLWNPAADRAAGVAPPGRSLSLK